MPSSHFRIGVKTDARRVDCLGGGVAANSRLRALATERAAARRIRVRVPRPGLCTDNGAMVAAAAHFRYQSGQRDTLALDVLPNLPIA